MSTAKVFALKLVVMPFGPPRTVTSPCKKSGRKRLEETGTEVVKSTRTIHPNQAIKAISLALGAGEH